MATVGHFFFLQFFTLILLVQARLNLETTDHEALLAIYNDLGVSTGSTSICNAAGIFCERRISNGTTVLRVTRIVFKHRRLRGSISPAIGKLSELKELSLPNNHLTNQIPAQITDCLKLEVLNLQNNRFSGKVPTGLSSLVRLRILDLSSNKFSGDLGFLKYFPNLEKLSLANNMFTGKVPASLRSFRNLRFFNISGNIFLSGPMPTLSRLESPAENTKSIPKRYIFAESNSTTNEDDNFDNPQPPALSPTGEPDRNHKSKAKKIIRWILGFSVGVVAGVICGTIVSILFKLILNLIRGKKNDFGPAIFSQLIKAEDLTFLENDDGVSSLQIIGKGGCGEVYKMELQDNKIKTIAIKKRTSEMSLVKWMRNVMVGEDPKQAIDEKLTGNGFEEHMLLVLKIACFCTLDDPKERPNSKDARTMLTQINH
ncbi:hypothetical protein L1987_47438 [Smallanthus sonchifolius]|uniref:Uncharacterized protein n=1 Tax=Smallanthus sonchifolius TaxID=185202 RepID=A0ACB9G2L0_9ASTR|nr:hypothetical protein L1987_47438 [Smallanthus sonchifolius]